jgi:hypothetical protein
MEHNTSSNQQAEQETPGATNTVGVMSFFTDKEKLGNVVYPIIAGVPTAILILFFFDLGDTYRDILNHFLSPIITGVTSGFILYTLGVKK